MSEDDVAKLMSVFDNQGKTTEKNGYFQTSLQRPSLYVTIHIYSTLHKESIWFRCLDQFTAHNLKYIPWNSESL